MPLEGITNTVQYMNMSTVSTLFYAGQVCLQEENFVFPVVLKWVARLLK